MNTRPFVPLLIIAGITVSAGCRMTRYDAGKVIAKPMPDAAAGGPFLKYMNRHRRTTQFAQLDPLSHGFEETSWRPLYNRIIESPPMFDRLPPISNPGDSDGIDCDGIDSGEEKEFQPTVDRLPPISTPESNDVDRNEPKKSPEEIVIPPGQRPIIQDMEP